MNPRPRREAETWKTRTRLDDLGRLDDDTDQPDGSSCWRWRSDGGSRIYRSCTDDGGDGDYSRSTEDAVELPVVLVACILASVNCYWRACRPSHGLVLETVLEERSCLRGELST